MKHIRVNALNSASIQKSIDYLNKYKDTLNDKCQTFVERLLERGIRTAQANSGEYGGMIKFEKKLNPSDYGCDGVLVATDGQKLIREWMRGGNVVSAEVSPLLMAEFGSGWLAKVLDPVEGVGQGTFPDQTHAFDPHGWWWETPDGEKHHSYGEAPTYPMHAASIAILIDADTVARKVFSK